MAWRVSFPPLVEGGWRGNSDSKEITSPNPSSEGKSIRRSNGVDDNGRICPCRLLDSRAYPVFDPGGDCGRRGTGHDRLRSVSRRNISGGTEFGAAGVGRCAIVIAVLVEA